MSKRSAFDTLYRIHWAFIESTSWSQADLARKVGISVRALRRRLLEMQEGHVPLTQDEEPPHVMWTVPNGWIPDGISLQKDDVAVALRLLARSPKSAARDKLLQKILRSAGDARPVVANSSSAADEEPVLATIEDARDRKVSVHMRYYSANRGQDAWRFVSVHRVAYGPRTRMIACCHTAGQLRWFRVSNVLQARLEPNEPFQARPEEEVEGLAARSIDGWADDAAPRPVSFLVLGDDARWVAKALPSPDMTVEPCPGGIRVRAVTSGVGLLARFVVGIGAAAVVETPELAERVEELARGALTRRPRGSIVPPSRGDAPAQEGRTTGVI